VFTEVNFEGELAGGPEAAAATASSGPDDNPDKELNLEEFMEALLRLAINLASKRSQSRWQKAQQKLAMVSAVGGKKGGKGAGAGAKKEADAPPKPPVGISRHSSVAFKVEVGSVEMAKELEHLLVNNVVKHCSQLLPDRDFAALYETPPVGAELRAMRGVLQKCFNVASSTGGRMDYRQWLTFCRKASMIGSKLSVTRASSFFVEIADDDVDPVFGDKARTSAAAADAFEMRYDEFLEGFARCCAVLWADKKALTLAEAIALTRDKHVDFNIKVLTTRTRG